MFHTFVMENGCAELCSTMRAEDVTDTLDLALAASGCDQPSAANPPILRIVGTLGCSAHVHHRPRLLSDNGPSYIAGELAEYIEAQRMSHVRVPRSIHKLKARSNAGTRP